MRFAGKSALVTGASAGIGRAIARALLAEGARVAACGRDAARLAETVAGFPDEQRRAITGDLRADADLERTAREAHDAFGALDVLVNAAGVWHDEQGRYQGPLLHETPSAQLDEVLGVGLRASMRLAQLMLPGMIARRRGKIVQLSCGYAGPHEAVGWLHYYVTNQAIEAFTRGLAAELRPHEIQVNCVAPWFVASEAARRFFPRESETALAPDDVARLVLYLASDEADPVSGQIIEARSKLDR